MNIQEHYQVRPIDFPPGCPVNSNTFPGKLWKLVNDDFFKSICWTNNGTSIGIDALKFKHEVLKCDEFAIFKTKNFSSFVRQLNLYGFRKLTAIHPSSRHCEFSENHIHTHPHQQLNSDLQHFQHNCFNRAHPELLVRVRRASAAQKRKAQEENTHFNTHGLSNGCHHLPYHALDPVPVGILRDRTNANYPHSLYHHGRQAPFPVSLHANQGKIFGLSLIASTSRGSLIATPPSRQYDFSSLCNQQGQLKKFVVIGQQNSGGSIFLGNNNHLSPTPPVLQAYNMSPLGNPHSSVGYALMEAPLDTSTSEAESAVAYLMNESFGSSPSVSPQLLSPFQQESPQQEIISGAVGLSSRNRHSAYRFSPDDICGDFSPRCSSSASSSHLSAPSSSAFLSATSSSSSDFGSTDLSSSSSSSNPCSSSFSSCQFSTSNSSTHSTLPSLGSSGSDNQFPSSPPSSLDLAPAQGSDIISSAFLSATQKSPSLPNLDMPRLSTEPPVLARQDSPMEEYQLAAPLPPSPVDFTSELQQNMSQNTAVGAAPCCRCVGEGQGSAPEQSAPQLSVQNFKPEPC